MLSYICTIYCDRYYLSSGSPGYFYDHSLMEFRFFYSIFINEKVQGAKDQEKAQSEKDSHSKNQGGKKPNYQSGTNTMKTFRKPNEQLFS